MAKRYFWLKLKNTYFNQLTQKKMKRQPNGKEMQIIYLRMLLISLDKEGYIHYQGVYDSIEEELAEEFDEPQEIVKQTIDFLINNNMVSVNSQNSLFMPEAMENVGSIGDSGIRMQNLREKEKASQCDGDVTECDADVIKRDGGVTQRREEQNITETDLHLNSDKSKSLDVKSKTDTDHADAVSDSADRPAGAAAAKGAAPQADDLFSVKQLLAIVEKNKVNLTGEGVQTFHEEMQESGWMLYGRPVEKKGIVKVLRGWAKYHPEYSLDQAEPENKRPVEKKTQPKSAIEDEIYEIASYYISQELFDENPGGHHTLISKFCPKEYFTEEQLAYMADKWCVWPKSIEFAEFDERSEYYHDLH